jgi:hypothetical protein
MNMLKKIFAVAAVSLAAPFFFGGATACGESCVAKCERLAKECSADADVSGCADACTNQDAVYAGACGSQAKALNSCIEGLSKDDRCAGNLGSCDLQPIIDCCTTNPDAAGCTPA